jgi:tripartite ATP-independent transporter DctM subunit
VNAVILVATFVSLLLLGLPVAIALLATSIGYALFSGGLPPLSVASMATYGVNSFVLLAVPAFILVAEVMNRSSLSQRIFDLARSLTGHLVGSLAHVNVLGSVFFAGISGSAMADVAGMGRIEIEAMKREGFPAAFAAAVTATSATIGPVIPPSIIMVVYATAAEQSTGRMFLGGFIPGLIMAAMMMVIIYLIARRQPWGRFPPASWAERGRHAVGAAPALVIPVVILGGLISGFWTPTEAGAVAAVYALLIAFFWYRDMKLGDLRDVLHHTAMATGNVMLIFVGAHIFSRLIVLEGVPSIVTTALQSFTDSPAVVLLLINIFLIIGGMFLEPTPFLLILVPVLLDIARAYSLDPVHLGVVAVVNLMLGNLTPPFALGLFAVSDIVDVPFKDLVKASVPFYAAFIVTLALITYIPSLVLWLPNLFLKPG